MLITQVVSGEMLQELWLVHGAPLQVQIKKGQPTKQVARYHA